MLISAVAMFIIQNFASHGMVLSKFYTVFRVVGCFTFSWPFDPQPGEENQFFLPEDAVSHL